MFMSFLKINNIEIPVNLKGKQGSIYRETEGRSLNSDYFSNKEITRLNAQFTTTIQNSSRAETLQGLISGQGHYFPFDDNIESNLGLSPWSSLGCTIVSSKSIIGSAVKLEKTMYIDTGYSSAWSANFWLNESSWKHFSARQDGIRFIDTNLSTQTTSSLFSLSKNGLLSIYASSSAPVYVDELLIVPYNVDLQFAQDLYNSTENFSTLPYLDITGDFTERGSIKCVGAVDKVEYQAVHNPSFKIDTQKVTFTLTEVLEEASS